MHESAQCAALTVQKSPTLQVSRGRGHDLHGLTAMPTTEPRRSKEAAEGRHAEEFGCYLPYCNHIVEWCHAGALKRPQITKRPQAGFVDFNSACASLHFVGLSVTGIKGRLLAPGAAASGTLTWMRIVS